MPSPTGMQIYDPQGHRLYLTGSERAAFRTAAEAAPREVRTYCWTLLYTGCRPSEALALTADRVDFQAAVLTFESQEETPPGRLSRRARARHAPGCPGSGAWPPRPRHPDVPLDVEPENRLHPRHRDHGTRRHRGPQASPKGLRHGFGVACIEKGIPLNLVQRWLGHAQLSTTAIYADAVGEEERHIAARLWA